MMNQHVSMYTKSDNFFNFQVLITFEPLYLGPSNFQGLRNSMRPLNLEGLEGFGPQGEKLQGVEKWLFSVK